MKLRRNEFGQIKTSHQRLGPLGSVSQDDRLGQIALTDAGELATALRSALGWKETEFPAGLKWRATLGFVDENEHFT